LGKNWSADEPLVLSYKQSMFSISFAALNYISSKRNQYAYKLEGFDQDWNYVGTKHTTTYTNLDPGKYIFRVKGSNNDGVWNEKGVALPIFITPPYWATIWFRLLLVAIAVGIIFWIYYWRMQARDLAAQKRMEVGLKKERNLLRTVINIIPDAVYVKDTASRKTIANFADVHNLGLQSEADVLGKDDFEFYPKELAEGFAADDRTVMQTGQPVIDREEYMIDGQGEKRWLVTSKVSLRDEKGQVVGLVGIGRDITTRKRAEAERERLIKELQDAVVTCPPESDPI
jgi:PAS domain S-box-containing protein